MAAGYETLIVEERGAVDWVTLNRPEALNALNGAMVSDLRSYFRALADRPERRIVVLKGAGRAFCAGLDLKQTPPPDRAANKRTVHDGLRLQRGIAEIYLAMRRCPQPIIALVHGPACGGGFSLAMASDLRIAGKSARMNCAYIRIGLGGCDMGSSYFLPRLVGAALAAELTLTGKFINAERALRCGLVSDVVEDDALDARAQEDIEYMLTNSPLGLRLSKEALNMNIDAGGLEAAIALEDRNQILCAMTDDATEARDAFLQKRTPQYKDA
ncbi:MAG: enoyl-CoA hydratase/isomerase family protein [Alphaproteobacteria bacterium]|nr:enoyl-CoA hydratase/isomerase family protein [Alphaproteobacteria bacterium]